MGGGGEVLIIAVSSKFRGFKWRYDLQLYEECVWVELPILDGGYLLIFNHYFPPNAWSKLHLTTFCVLEKKFDTKIIALF